MAQKVGSETDAQTRQAVSAVATIPRKQDPLLESGRFAVGDVGPGSQPHTSLRTTQLGGKRMHHSALRLLFSVPSPPPGDSWGGACQGRVVGDPESKNQSPGEAHFNTHLHMIYV